ncbi:acetylajmalan esterase-like isoform X1 [Solanum dulcamara]|uniref:acetylajmalan esterase-like isoform X1 n=1 Tax=Solanum dulcamara TaxID=45834 RepID=UPI0024868EF0|nr:acetylajmalan esterase-like isoform X1 [Solanum dulcamara]XP_055816749.1 acetylajmalan esterase-like isoform X1 [Solanum dulcamara]
MAMALHFLIIIIAMSLLVLQADSQELLIKLEKTRLQKCGIDKIYQFGDSLSDTGNCLKESYCGAQTKTGRLPYGMNFYQNATGRCSDGMLMIDFIAMECGLPLLNPWEDENADFSHGANFAVSGATALSVESLEENNIAMSFTNSTLSVQLDWMSYHFKSICSPDCSKYLEKSLFILGEIGGDDSYYGLKQSKTIDELRRMTPEIVHTIINSVRTIIDFGATRIIVPGNFPAGCFPIILSFYMTNPSTAYDEYHCVKEWNNVLISYNNHLQQAIHELKREYPNISIIYGDYYNAYLWLQQNAVALGFEKNTLQQACCGLGGDYNYKEDMKCGDPRVPVCADPSTYISWDGGHLTQKAYNWITKWLINDILPQLNCHV